MVHYNYLTVRVVLSLRLRQEEIWLRMPLAAPVTET